jgi:lipopolysaccharide export system permease protein
VKLIDRYLLRNLMAPLACCLAAFIMIFIVHDLYGHLEDFVKASTSFLDILRYYLFLIPSVFYLIVPLALLLAILYSLAHLTKNNELTAMRASGVSLYRLLVPILATGLVFVAVVYVINEQFAPFCASWCDRFVRQEKHRHASENPGKVDLHIVYDHPLKNDINRRIWSLQEFNSVTHDIKGVEMIQEREDGSYKTKYQAKAGEYLDGNWWFHNVTVQPYDEHGNPRGAARYVPHLEMSHLTETPKDFLNEIKDHQQFMSAGELIAFLDTHPNASEGTIARYRTEFHVRRAGPWTCLVVTLLGIPLGSATGRRGAFFGIFGSITLFFCYYVAIIFCLALGKQGSLSPWIAGWLPNMIFMTFGLSSLYRMR